MKYFISIVVFFQLASLHAQRYQLEFNVHEKGLETPKAKFQSRNAALPYLRKTVSRFHAAGYWEASVDSVVVKDSTTLLAYFSKGPLYTYGEISTKGIPKEIRHESGLRDMTGKKADPDLLQRNTERLLHWCEEHGYPFASVKLDSVTMNKNMLQAVWILDKGPMFRVDSVIIKGPGKLPTTYITNYIRIRPGDEYKESLVREVDKRIREIPFLTQIKPSEIVFTPKQSALYIYVKKKNASNFNGVLGLLPDAITGKMLITGDARVSLRNAFNRGEGIEANWRRLGNKTQDMRVFLQLPYLFKTPLGTELLLKLYKRDTSYIEVTQHAAITYNFSPGNFIKVLYQQYTSDMITINALVNQSNVLRFSDLKTRSYGLGYTTGKTDHIYNPRRGYRLNVEGLAGHKTIRPNAGINDSLYTNLQTRTENYTGNLTTEFFIPLFRQSALRLGNQTRVMINPIIFQNETMRLGGIRTLRGFDEESINTTAFTVFTAEYRFLFEENSFAYLFFDQAWYENNLTTSFTTDTPFGFGAGISFGMKTGIFTLNYALGSQFGNPIQLRGSKVHFGFISYF